MKTFEVHYILNNKYYQELVTTTNSSKAHQIIWARYPGSKITLVKQVS